MLKDGENRPGPLDSWLPTAIGPRCSSVESETADDRIAAWKASDGDTFGPAGGTRELR